MLGRAQGENFRVASRLLGRTHRDHLLAFYAFARFTDEIGDSYAGDRLAALDWLESETHAALDDPAAAHPLVGPAARAVTVTGADPADLLRLIEANRLDQTVSRYETYADLRRYCALSAEPVGHLVLAAFGAATPATAALADPICTALQLAEHWQDVSEDHRAGRVYVPRQDLERFGVVPGDLGGPGPAGPPLRALMAFEVWRARQLLDSGRPLVGLLTGRARLAVAGFWAGGAAALDAIAGADFDVLSPTLPARAGAARHLVALLMGARC